MITGYNTDVEYDGIVYHVQTEDKGLETPVILSLVYAGGEVLASKRSAYDDLVARDFDQAILRERLQRQHKLICAAVHAGRIEDLKRLSARESSGKSQRKHADRTAAASSPPVKAGADSENKSESTAAKVRIPISGAAADDDLLAVRLVEEQELRGGEPVTLRVKVSRAIAVADAREPAANVRVVVKTLGSTFRPSSTFSTTDKQGIASFSLLLPKFEKGRAAILVRAEADGETAELRRIILPPDIKA